MDVAEIIYKTTMERPESISLIADHNGMILAVSNAYQRIVNKTEAELVGRNISELIWETNAQRVLDTGKPIIGYNWIVNDKFEGVMSSFPLKRDNKIVGCLSLCLLINNADSKINSIEKFLDEINLYKSELSSTYSAKFGFDDIIGQSPDIVELKRLAVEVAHHSDTTVLIQGETGTGKELFANALHRNSARSNNPFVHVNCAAIPQNLIETEFFGYEGGAFTDAAKRGKIGKFELANNGTLFLDEIGEMPLFMQSKLLIAMQNKSIERIGGIKPINLNIRIIAASNKDLAKMVHDGLFREDLYFRINVIKLEIPPLRNRRTDIPVLAKHFLFKQTLKLKSRINTFSSEAINLLCEYNWPGNARELENVVERAILFADMNNAPIIDCQHLNSIAQEILFNKIPLEGSLKELMTNFEKNLIKNILMETNNNKNQASKILKIDKSHLYRKLRDYGLTDEKM